MTFTLILLLILAICSPAQAELSRQEVLAEVQRCAVTEGVDPDFAGAVAMVESGLKCGPLGKRGRFVGPMGIARCYKDRFDIYDWRENVRVGVRALRGKDKLKVLRRYNAASNRAYERAVLAKMRELKNGR
jgi:hypothetical protein